MNLICLYYLCRSSGNSKQYNGIVFHNPNDLSPTEVDAIIRQHVLEHELFIPSQWGLPDFRLEKTEDTPVYHEYVGVQKVKDTFQREITTIESLLEKVKASKY